MMHTEFCQRLPGTRNLCHDPKLFTKSFGIWRLSEGTKKKSGPMSIGPSIRDMKQLVDGDWSRGGLADEKKAIVDTCRTQAI